MPSDEELIKKALRAVLEADSEPSGKALEAKAAAARQLAKMNGLLPDAAGADSGAEEDEAPDPMADLDELETRRRRRAA